MVTKNSKTHLVTHFKKTQIWVWALLQLQTCLHIPSVCSQSAPCQYSDWWQFNWVHIGSDSLVVNHFDADCWLLQDVSGSGCLGDPSRSYVIGRFFSRSPESLVPVPPTSHHQQLFFPSLLEFAKYHWLSVVPGRHITTNRFHCFSHASLCYKSAEEEHSTLIHQATNPQIYVTVQKTIVSFLFNNISTNIFRCVLLWNHCFEF